MRFILPFILVISFGSFQNLIQGQYITNGDFEIFDQCPFFDAQIEFATGWIDYDGTSDLHACDFTGYWGEYLDDPTPGAQSGEAHGFMAGLAGITEGMLNELNQPFLAGQTYNLKFWVKSPEAEDGLGCPDSDFSSSICVNGYNSIPVPVASIDISDVAASFSGPVFEMGCFLIDHEEWREIEIIFTPDFDLTYLAFSSSTPAPSFGYIACNQALHIDNITADLVYTFCQGDTEFTIDPEVNEDLDWFENQDGNLIPLGSGSTITVTPVDGMVIQTNILGTNVFYPLLEIEVPEIELNETQISLCNGEEFTFEIPENIYDSVLWNNNFNSLEYTATFEESITVQAFLNGCSTEENVQVLVSDIPTSDDLIIINPSCAGVCNGEINLPFNTDWNYLLNGQTVSNLNPNLCPGEYDIQVENLDCVFSQAVSLVTTEPVITLTSDTTVCSGSNLQLNASSDTDMIFQWSNGSAGNSIDIAVNEPSEYCVTGVFGENNQCSTAEYCVQLNTFPELNVEIETELFACPNSTVELSPVILDGAGEYDYLWLSGTTTLDTSSTLELPIGNISQTVDLIVSDRCNTEGESLQININLEEFTFPTPTFSENGSCLPVELYGIIPDLAAGTSVFWDVNEEATYSTNGLNHTVTSAGCQDITLTLISENNCTYENTYSGVSCIDELPLASFFLLEDQDENLISFETVNESLNAEDYEWELNGVSTSSEENTNLDFDSDIDAGNLFELCLTAISEAGCTDNECQIIEINSPIAIYIPNAFTPDNDGLNESFGPVLNFEPDFFEFRIFNRWGLKIFQSNDPNELWAANVNGGEYYTQDEIYTWQIIVKRYSDQQLVEKTGFVQVLR